MTPAELVRKYKSEGYEEIAITDHDGIDGIKEAAELGVALGIRVIAGIEISADFYGTEIHILGYDFDLHDSRLNKELEKLKESRSIRNRQLREALADMGFPLAEEDLYQRPEQQYIGKPNFARALAEKGYAASPEEAFEPGKFLETPQIKALERYKPAAENVIRLILQAGGTAVLAHPGKIKGIGPRGSRQFWENFEILLKKLKIKGLSGLECYYPQHSAEEEKQFCRLAGKYGLYVTKGSDFHGNF